MDESLIQNWNNVVKPNDLVYHLGDFCLGRLENFDSYFNKLNGKIILIEGNHDRNASKNKGKFLQYHKGCIEINLDGWPITLCHYAMKVWNNSHHGSFHLYGHSHGTLPDDNTSLSFDIGVDCHNFAPVSFEGVKKIMETKTFRLADFL